MSTLKCRTLIRVNTPIKKVKKNGLNLTDLFPNESREKMALSDEKTDTVIPLINVKRILLLSVKQVAIQTDS